MVWGLGFRILRFSLQGLSLHGKVDTESAEGSEGEFRLV